jgi:hypothetical protein
MQAAAFCRSPSFRSPILKFDDASWHYGGDFPDELPQEAGATHIGMFVAWCLLNGLAGEVYTTELASAFEKLRSRASTPGAWFLHVCDGKFTDEDLNDDGAAFAESYYDGDTPQYLEDYDNTLGSELESLYHVPDTWASYDALAPILAPRFKEWKKAA